MHTEEQWRLLKSLANQGRADSGGWLEHARFGYNYRLDDLSAAVGLAQMEKLDDILARRLAVAARYAGLLAASTESSRRCQTMPITAALVRLSRSGWPRDRPGARHRRADRARHRDESLPPVDSSPALHARAVRLQRGRTAASEEASRRMLALPFFPELARDDQEYVVDELRASIERQ